MSVRSRVVQGHLVGKLAATLMLTASLAACSGLGLGTSADAPLFTGSTGANANPIVNQPMPGVLPSAQAGQTTGPYLPPADVGRDIGGNRLVTGSISPTQLSTVGQGTTPTIIAQDLPSLPQTQASGSQPMMNAQSNVTPLFRDDAVPTTTSQPTSQPNLTVVPDGAFQHTIERGESLYTIARRYGVTTDALVRANNLEAPDQIFVGQRIFVPGRSDLLSARAPQTQSQTSQATDPVVTASVSPAPATNRPQAQVAPTQQTSTPAPTASQPAPQQVAELSTPPASAATSFRWPIQGRVIVDFAQSRDTGINIEAPEGASVRAAENGTVIYVGNGVEGYGNLVLVRHANGYVSAYAHLKDVTVAKDDVIRRGDTIGTVGMSGSVSRPQLHFELRQGATPVDPMPLLAG